MSDTLDTLEATEQWDGDERVLDALGRDDVVFKIWGDDGCIDCQQQLPAFAAALDAAGVPDERIVQYPVERTPEGKVGPKVDEYGIDLIPTVVVEREADGAELARFVESADEPIAEYLAARLEDAEASV